MPKERSLKSSRQISKRQFYRRVKQVSLLQSSDIFENSTSADEAQRASFSEFDSVSSSSTASNSENFYADNSNTELDQVCLNENDSEIANTKPVEFDPEHVQMEPVELCQLSTCETHDSESDIEPRPINHVEPELEDTDLQSFLAQWAVQHGITQVAVSALLKKLVQHPCHSDLPTDARTLLKTPRSTDVKEVPPGQYVHLGLRRGIINLLKKHSDEIGTEIELAIGIDGLPISKSSRGSLWPILGSFVGFNDVFLIGAYYGNEKPAVSSEFLYDCIQEAKDLCLNGLQIPNKIFRVSIKYFVCDAPAKSFILNVKGHSGYSSCTKCTIVGEFRKGRVCFPSSNAQERTDADFRGKTDEDYHAGYCCLEDIPGFNLIVNVPLDYMHLVCLGVMRKLVYLWMFGNLDYRLPHRKLTSISNTLENFRKFIPFEFARKPRSLVYVKQWKATEYRQFLLYSGPICLKHILPQDIYLNFMTLHIAIRILCSANLNLLLDYARDLLQHFFTSFITLYGKHNASHNIHGLIHLVEDVKNFGNLDEFSAFRFENYMQTFKKLLRKSDAPLQQLCRRYLEIERNSQSAETNKQQPGFNIIIQSSHYDGPLPENCRNPQYEIVSFSGYRLIAGSEADSYCGLVGGEIIVVKNFAYDFQNNIIVAIGHEYVDKEKLFNQPCDSSLLGIWCVETLSRLRTWPVTDIKTKLVILPHGSTKFAVFPMLHLETN